MGAEREFDEFFAATFRRLTVQVFAMTGNLGEAEDAVQEAFARAWQRWPKVGRYGDAEAWVRTVAFRIAVSSWRKSVNRLAAHRKSQGEAVVPELSADRLALIQALRRVGTDQRQVLVLHYLAGLAVDDIARELAVSVNTVKSRLHRGRKALAPFVSEFADDPEGSGPVAGSHHTGREGGSYV